MIQFRDLPKWTNHPLPSYFDNRIRFCSEIGSTELRQINFAEKQMASWQFPYF